MQTLHVFFNPFYQLVILLLFSSVRLVKKIYQDLFQNNSREIDEENPKFQLFWSICYVIFTVSVFYNSILLLFSPQYATISLLSMLLPIIMVLLGAFRYFCLLVTEQKSMISLLTVVITAIYELFALDVLIPYLGTYLSTFWIFLPLGASITIIFSPKKRYHIIIKAHRRLKFWKHWIWDVLFWGGALIILILQNVGLSLVNILF